MPDDSLRPEPTELIDEPEKGAPSNLEGYLAPGDAGELSHDDSPPVPGSEPEATTERPLPSVLLDTHSAPAAITAPDATTQAHQQAEESVPPATASAPIVEATVHATQVAVSTAKQATQQVTAAVQQQAQKVTVAPRKAIYRGKRFLIGYGVLTAGFGVLAALAKRYKYFPADVGVTRLLQRPRATLYDKLMHAVSNLGWRWISVGTRASLSTLMWLAGFRMEGAFTLSTWSGDVVTVLIKTRVLRPRPTKDLVRVASHLDEASFPSGHVVHYVTFYGFLYYLVHTHLKRRWFRTLLLSVLGGIIALVGPSRIYMGHHWPSDVGGAYFVGTLWLGVTIIAYLETKANYTLHTHPPFLVKRPQQLN
jgi:membrane-associated phospholipid phosphatase